jgi:hypothetical protein
MDHRRLYRGNWPKKRLEAEGKSGMLTRTLRGPGSLSSGRKSHVFKGPDALIGRVAVIRTLPSGMNDTGSASWPRPASRAGFPLPVS